jgi:pimeloyl-ACP methyl ester carboxylesterase
MNLMEKGLKPLRSMNFGSMTLRSVLRITLAVIIGYPLFLSLFFYFFQERFIFIPAPISTEALEWTREGFVKTEEIKIKTADNTNLHGWLVKDPKTEKSPLLIYFGGNAEEVSGILVESARFRGWSLLAVNYRGYGLSEGSPTQEDLVTDALVVYDYIVERDDIDIEKIAVMGRSLGTGVAVYLASERPLIGVILVSPFDSMTNVFKDLYRFLPASVIIKHPFDSVKLAPSVKTPMLALAGTLDRTVRPARSMLLVEAWGGEYELKLIEGKDHETIEFHDIYWRSIREFLEGL